MELLVFDSNNWNHLTVCQQIINIEWNYEYLIAII